MNMPHTNSSDNFCNRAPQKFHDEAYNALTLRNGQKGLLADIPILSLPTFTQWLTAHFQAGSRVVAFFALPQPLSQNATSSQATPGRHTLAAVMARDTDATLHIASVQVESHYPSFTPSFPALHLFERVLHEEHGILPQGHPWLKPVRFSRADGPPVGITDFYRIAGTEVHEVAVGPIHAGVIECGHFRFQCLGEVVMHLEISLGYHHRGILQHCTGTPSTRTLALMETVAGDSTIAHTWAHCTLMEALSETQASPRGQLLRALALELERLANHTGDLGALAGDTGFLSTLAFCGRLRGDWLNLSALVCGSRFGRGWLCPGYFGSPSLPNGVRFDIDSHMARTLLDRIRKTARDVKGAVQLLWDSPSVMARMTGTGRVSTAQATALGLVGVPARASGLARDVRHTHPLSDLPNPPPIQLMNAAHCQNGDVLARAMVRSNETEVSAAFCTHLVEMLADGANSSPEDMPPPPAPTQKSLAPNSIALALTESWRGEVCHIAITNDSGSLAGYEIIDPSFHNWMGLAIALRQQDISDFPLCNKSFNLSYCGHDL